MPDRRLANIRVSWVAHRKVQRLADDETGGNWSEMARKLMAEALTARTKKERK